MSGVISSPDLVGAPRDLHWKAQGIVATRGNQTLWGAIYQAAILGRVTDNGPRFLGAAEVNKDGWVLAPFQRKGESVEEAEVRAICHVDDMVKAFRLLADHLKLEDEAREELFFNLRAWITKDERAAPSILE